MTANPIPNLRVPQARVLRALMPVCPTDTVDEWPLLTRAVMAVRAGYTPISGSITRALMGIRQGSSSGDAHLGLIDLKLVETIELNIMGTLETNYRATPLGVRAMKKFLQEGGKLPPVRDAAVHTNQRYAKTEVVDS